MAERMVEVQYDINDQDNKKRLKEILEILIKNEVTKPLNPEKLKATLQDLGPIFSMLGNIMADKKDAIPKEYRDKLKSISLKVSNLNYDNIINIIETEYGKKAEELFIEIDKDPARISFLSQCHRAILRDGQAVTLQIKRPDIYDYFCRDMALLKKSLDVLKLELNGDSNVNINYILDQISLIAKQEMDFTAQAENADHFYELNVNDEFIISPIVYTKYCTQNILVIEYIKGINIDNTQKLEANNYNLKLIARNLVSGYVKQVFKDGFFHLNLTPKNVVVKNGKIAFLDFALVGNLNKDEIKIMQDMMLSINNNDIDKLKNNVLAMGDSSDNINNSKLYSELDFILSKYKSGKINDFENIIAEIANLFKENGIALKDNFAILFSSFISIEKIAKNLDNDINIIDMISNYGMAPEEKHVPEENIEHQESKHMAKEYNEVNIEPPMDYKPRFIADEDVNNIKDTKIEPQMPIDEISEDNPDKSLPVSDIIGIMADSDKKINLNISINDSAISIINKIINNLIIGLIAVGMLICSCVILSTDMSPKLYEMPILGIVMFVISIILILVLLVKILFHKK